MSMTFRYRNSSGASTFDVDLGTSVVRLGSITSGFADRAELGEPAQGGVELDDPGGTLDILPLQYLVVVESDAPAGDNVVHIGLIGEERIARGDAQRASLRTGAARVWSLTISDPNEFLALRLLHSFSRPAETAGARLTALLAVSNCPVHDLGLVVYPSHAMDKCDYTWQSFQQCLADIAAQAGFNYFAYYSQSAGQFGLWFNDPDGVSYNSAARISNVLSDLGAGVYAPVEGTTTLTRSPSRIASTAVVQYSGGSPQLYYDAPTADLYTAIDRVAPSSNVKSAAAALAIATKFQRASASPSDRIATTIRVPRANVNDIRAGHRIQVRFSHLATSLRDYSAWTMCRVMSRTVLQPEETDQTFQLVLELTPGIPPLSCSLAVSGAPVGIVSAQAYTTGSYTCSVAVTRPSAIIAVFTASDPNTPGDSHMALSAGITTTLAADMANETTAMGWAAGSSVTSVTGTYTPGYNPPSSVESAVVAAFATAASAPVQTGTANSFAGLGGTVTLGATPTPGNTIVMAMGVRSLGLGTPGVPPDPNSLTPSTGWTLVGIGYCLHGEPVDAYGASAIYARCVQAGDGRVYGQASGSYAAAITVMEWQLL